MMEQLGIRALRPGPSGNEQDPNHANYDETRANPFTRLPDLLTLKDGRKLTTRQLWARRRAEIAEDFEREVYGRVPRNVPGMLWRIENGELDGVDPKVIVIFAGTNNVGQRPGGDGKVADITRGFRALIDLCRRKAPNATIIVTGILPRDDNIAVVPEIERINENIARFADGRSIRYLDINDKLADSTGKLFDGMTLDGLHLSVKGYQVWADVLRPIFTELLGPPAATDEAPPPTGDPSARRP